MTTEVNSVVQVVLRLTPKRTSNNCGRTYCSNQFHGRPVHGGARHETEKHQNSIAQGCHSHEPLKTKSIILIKVAPLPWSCAAALLLAQGQSMTMSTRTTASPTTLSQGGVHWVREERTGGASDPFSPCIHSAPSMTALAVGLHQRRPSSPNLPT